MEIADKVVADGLWIFPAISRTPSRAAAVSAVIDIVQEEGLLDRAARRVATLWIDYGMWRPGSPPSPTFEGRLDDRV